jgi:hypothetical protein
MIWKILRYTAIFGLFISIIYDFFVVNTVDGEDIIMSFLLGYLISFSIFADEDV